MTVLEEEACIVRNEQVGPRLHMLELESPSIAQSIAPGQFVHVRIPNKGAHILRRPFSIYDCSEQAGTMKVLYQEVGSLTKYLPTIQSGHLSVMGPLGNGWSALQRLADGRLSHALIVGGGVGAAPLFMLVEQLARAGALVDVVLGAQTKDALVCREDYARVLGREPLCATDDGSFGTPGFCTVLSQERLTQGSLADGLPYDYVAVCGPEPLMRIVCAQATEAGVFCELSLERRMACGIGACLSCVVETKEGKKRSCVDGPIFDACEVVWQ